MAEPTGSGMYDFDPDHVCFTNDQGETTIMSIAEYAECIRREQAQTCKACVALCLYESGGIGNGST